jgi:pimeloyl-ACP methyl ester carboxylesterase
MVTRVFIHGLESSPQGRKASYFRERYPDMIIPYFQGGLEERMRDLDCVLAGRDAIRIVGSSFGGLMAALFALANGDRVARMVLLAPALNHLPSDPELPARIRVPVWIYHGSDDRVIPLSEVQRISTELFANLSFFRVADDHYLHKTFPTIEWDELLS